MSRAAHIFLFVIGACDSKPAVETPPAAEPAAAPSVLLPQPGPRPSASDPGLLHIEAMTRTLWRIDEPVLTEVLLELIAGRIVCRAVDGGCRLDEFPQDSVLRRLGIESGDVVREIVGEEVTDGASLQQAIHRARASGMIAVVVQRGTEARRHRYRLRTLAPPSPRAERKERGFDLLAEAVRRDDDGQFVVDAAAADLFLAAFHLDVGRGLSLLGVDPKAQVSGETTQRVPADTPAHEGEVVLEIAVTEGTAPPRTVTVVARAGLVEPELLTALRALFPAERPREPDEMPRAPLPADPAPATDDAFPGITAVSDSEFTVSRAAYESLMADPTALSRAARIVPDRSGAGFKLYGIRSPSAGIFTLRQVGFMNGDVVRAVNGHDLSDIEAAMDALAKVRKAEQLAFEIERRGATMTITIRVVD